MSALHTAGPWVHRVMTMPRKVWAALGRSEIQVVAKNGNVIAAVWCAEDRPGEAEANAVLIAAVIDLLTLAFAMRAHIQHWQGDAASNLKPTPESLAAALAETNAVITKATGAA